MGARKLENALPWTPQVDVIRWRRGSTAELQRISARRGLGFDPREVRLIQRYFQREGRDPTDLELAGLAQSWSEHCSYKSSKAILRKAFAGLAPRPKVLGTGDAGVVRFEDGWAYALRIESHNHPSAVEPYGGAATGIGGILRDVLAVGGKPIALSDPLFFGPLDLRPENVPKGMKSPHYLMAGVVSGIRDYGNRVGVPTVSGGVYFDPAYVVNPLVNVACVGILPRHGLKQNRARRSGDRLVLAGGLTGRDGIGGVAFASQELTERSEEESRGAVQLGNPIMKEPLIHACLDCYDRDLVQGVKDLGGGGLASASGELVNGGGFGSRIELDRVPLREPGLLPWEVWISESQERMLLSVRPRDLGEVLSVFEKHDVPARGVGEVTPGPFEEIRWHDQLAGKLRVAFRVAPKPLHRPTQRRRRVPRAGISEPRPDLGTGIPQLFEELVLAPDSVSRESIVRVYEHEVQGHTVLKPLQGRVESPTHGDAAVLRPRPGSWRGLAISTAAQPWICREDPRAGGSWVVEEAARNLYSVGARPDALSDCLNFGNPEDPVVLGDFSEVVTGLASAAKALGFAVPSGNVSFYNGGLGRAIPPTPVLIAVGILPDIRHAVSSDAKQVHNPLYLIGESSSNLGGSLWARLHGHRVSSVPPANPLRLRSTGDRLLRAVTNGWVASAHDVSDGGLAVTLAEMAFGGGLGFSVDLASTGLTDPRIALAAEGASRIVVEVPEHAASSFERHFHGLPAVRLGKVTDEGGSFFWNDEHLASVPLGPLYVHWRAGLGIP